MSRATVDLQAVRFFLGYGLVFMLQSALTIFLAGGGDDRRAARAGGDLAHPGPDRGLRRRALRRRARPALQELQQRIAELTADVEENIGGVRVVKAFAREDRQLERFRGGVGRVWDQAMVTTRLQAFYNPFIGFLPQLGLAAILFFGGRQVIDGRLTIGEFSAFYAYLLMLLSPMRTLGILLGLAQRATAAGARVYQILDREPRIVSAPGAPALPPGSGHVELRGVTLQYEGASRPVLHDVDLDVPPAAPSPWSAPPARARRRSCSSSRACTTSAPARCSSTAPTCATSTSPRCAPPSPSSTTIPSSSAPPWPRTSPTRAPTRRARRSSSRPGAPRPTTSSRACPRATTRAWASAG